MSIERANPLRFDRQAAHEEPWLAFSVNEQIAKAVSATREGRHADAYDILLQAMAVWREAEDGRALVVALKRLGQHQRNLGRVEESRQSYTAAVTVCRQLDDPLLLAHTLRHLGDLHREAGSPKSAELLCVEALAIYRQHSTADALDLANAIRSLALLNTGGRSAAGARSLWQEALGLYAAAGVSEGVAECRSNLSLIGGDPA